MISVPFSVAITALLILCSASHSKSSHDGNTGNSEALSKQQQYIANQHHSSLDSHDEHQNDHNDHNDHIASEHGGSGEVHGRSDSVEVVAPQSGDYLGGGPDDDALHGSFRCDGLQDISIEVFVAHGQVELTMVGPQGEWFAFGFGSFRMEGTYAIIAGDECVADYLLSKGTVAGDQSDNKIADSPLTVLSDESDGFYRTIKVQRPREHPATFSFPSNIGELPIISAKAAYKEHRVAYHGNNRSPQRLQLQRVGGGGDYGHYTPIPTRHPPTPRPPTPRPTARPTYKPTVRPTMRPTKKPTAPWPTPRPPTPRRPTPSPTHAVCCIAKPGTGENGYSHAARHHQHPMTCDDASYSRAICEKLLNSAGNYRCDWHQGPECVAQEAAALERNKAEAAQFEKEEKERLEREEKERAEWEMAEKERLEREQKEEAEWLSEFEAGKRRMDQIEEERRIEDEQWKQQLAEQELAEQERLRREAMAEDDQWDGPQGECVWDGSTEITHKTDAKVYDNQCQVLGESECVRGGPYGRCQWVGFNHLHFPSAPKEEALAVDVRAILNLKVSALDLLLGVAFVVTASFAMHQLLRWCSERREFKRMSSGNEATPLLVGKV